MREVSFFFLLGVLCPYCNRFPGKKQGKNQKCLCGGLRRTSCQRGFVCAGRCPETAGSPRRAGPLFCLRTNVCGDVQRNHSFFSPARLADKRAPEPPSCQSPLPEARFLASGLHPSNVRTSEILHRCSISSGPTADGTSSISPFARRINRAFTKMSGTDRFEARSTPRMQIERVSSFDSVEARRAMQIVRLVSSTCSLHLCW